MPAVSNSRAKGPTHALVQRGPSGLLRTAGERGKGACQKFPEKSLAEKSSVRNEALDCEVYALHAARSLKLHMWTPARWLLEFQQQAQESLV